MRLRYDPHARAVVLNLKSAKPDRLSLLSKVYGSAVDRPLLVKPGAGQSVRWSVARSGNWYDITLQKDGFVRRFAGRLETASHGVSDPAMHAG